LTLDHPFGEVIATERFGSESELVGLAMAVAGSASRHILADADRATPARREGTMIASRR
jgi:hypothetical protein